MPIGRQSGMPAQVRWFAGDGYRCADPARPAPS